MTPEDFRGCRATHVDMSWSRRMQAGFPQKLAEFLKSLEIYTEEPQRHDHSFTKNESQLVLRRKAATALVSPLARRKLTK